MIPDPATAPFVPSVPKSTRTLQQLVKVSSEAAKSRNAVIKPRFLRVAKTQHDMIRGAAGRPSPLWTALFADTLTCARTTS